MMKFRCQSCGHRIAVPPRMMGRLVNCPECGGVTHPFAEQLVAGAKSTEVATAEAPAVNAPSSARRPEKTAAAHQVRHCDNCGRLIGRLEQSHLWRGNLVCPDCHPHLPHEDAAPTKLTKRRPAKAAQAVVAPAATKVQVLAARRMPRAEDMPPDNPRPPSRFSLFLATKPARAILALCSLGLAIYFVYSFVQVIGLMANLLVVGLLLIAALFFLFRPGPQRASDDAPAGTEQTLARRP
jgi:predicted RNA-binding Zn-ribbon protein involved in translation (DUF1610 family)